jgi:hypothetical protein
VIARGGKNESPIHPSYWCSNAGSWRCGIVIRHNVGQCGLTSGIVGDVDGYLWQPFLDSRWSWVREDPSRWSLTAHPGFLRLTTRQGELWPANNLLVQNAPGGDYEIQSRVIFTPTQNYQIAGLLAYQDDNNLLTLGRAFCDTPPPTCLNHAIYLTV